MTVGQGLQIGSPQVIGYERAQLLLVLIRRELLDDRDALRVGEGMSYLLAQGALAQRSDASAKLLEGQLVIDAGKLQY